MAHRFSRRLALAVTALSISAAGVVATPADAVLILVRDCPPGYIGVEVYGGSGMIAWACVVDPLVA